MTKQYQDATLIMWFVGLCLWICVGGDVRVCVCLYPEWYRLSHVCLLLQWLLLSFYLALVGLWLGLKVDTLILPLGKKLLCKEREWGKERRWDSKSGERKRHMKIKKEKRKWLLVHPHRFVSFGINCCNSVPQIVAFIILHCGPDLGLFCCLRHVSSFFCTLPK